MSGEIGTVRARVQVEGDEYTLDTAVAAEVRAEIARHLEITVTSLAERLGCSRVSMSRRINGHRPFSAADLDRIAVLMGLRASDLVVRAERALGERAA